MPALLILVTKWNLVALGWFCGFCSLLGCGVVLMIPLRKALIVAGHGKLPFLRGLHAPKS